MNEAAVSASESNIIALFPQKSVENGAELGHQKPRSQSKAEIVIGAKDPQSEYAKDWTNVADGLRALIEAHKGWKADCYPDAKEFFPSHCGGLIEERALAHALRRLTSRFVRKLRSHGMWAWYVLVRRSQGASDAQIAMELGHTSGGACIASTYGGVPDEWRRGGGPNMSWVPEKFAWEYLQKNGWKFEKEGNSGSRTECRQVPPAEHTAPFASRVRHGPRDLLCER